MSPLSSHWTAYAELLTNSLIANEKKRIYDRQIELVSRNAALGKPIYGYSFKGTQITPYNRAALARAKVRLSPIHFTLADDANELFIEDKKLQSDAQTIKQALTVPLTKCTSKQDFRDVLPDFFLKYCHSEIYSLPRTREVGFNLQDSPMLYKQYQKALDIAYYYLGNDLLF
jgi:hypothetical protein